MKIRSIVFLALLGVTANGTPLHSSSKQFVAPLHVPQVASNELVNNSYIIVFNDDVQPSAFQSHMQFLSFANDVHPLHTDADGESVSGVAHVYDSIIAKGYAATLSPDVLQMIRRRPEVKYVEQEKITRLSATQANAPWVRTAYFVCPCTDRLITLPPCRALHALPAAREYNLPASNIRTKITLAWVP